MKPIEHMPTMAALDFLPSLTNSDMTLPLCLQAVALFLQEDIGQHRQRPEAHDGRRAHHLILIPAQFFLAITKEDLDVPAGSDMDEQHLRGSFQIAGGPIAGLRERGIQRLAHDHDLTEVEFAHACGHHMHIHVVVALGPLELAIVAVAQLGRIVAELLPPPALGGGGVFYPQPAVAFESRGDEEPALARCSPEAFGAVPGIEQDVRHAPCNRLKGPNDGLHQRNLAGEGHAFRFADPLLSIQLRSQWAAPPQEHIQTLHHAMTGDPFPLRRRMMPPQPFHLLALRLVHRRVVPDQIPCHDGLLGTASMLGLLLALSLQLCCHLRLHRLAKVPQPAFCHGFGFPGRFGEKAAQPCQARSRADLTQQATQGAPAFTLHQPKPHDHEVLVLGLGEKLAEPFGKVAHVFIQTYNGNWHRTPPWSQRVLFFSLIPHGVLSCHSPFQKCKHREYTFTAYDAKDAFRFNHTIAPASRSLMGGAKREKGNMHEYPFTCVWNRGDWPTRWSKEPL